MRRKSASTLLCTIVLILALFGGVTGAAAETAPAVPVAKASVAISSGMFPDAAFRSYVSSNIDKDSDGTLSESEINAVTTINVSGNGISSLQGIGLFVNLRTLNCMNNQLTSLDISGNPALESLNCSFNYLTELDLSRNPELDYLECESNHLTNLDFSNTRLTQTSTYTLNSSYTITSPIDLSTLPGSFDISRASDWSRGTISGTILTASEGEVTYRYDCGNNCKKTFTLYVSGSALPTYVVTFDANGGSGAPEPQTRTYGENLHLSETIPVRSGYSFIGWSTSPNGTSIQYLPGGIYSGDKDITLYAIWQSDTSSYTISYNANGGTGAPASQTKTHGVTLTLSATKPTRTGYTFLGWSDSSTATGAKYSAGGSYTANGNATLYAVWKANTYTVSYNANGGTGAPASQTKTHGVTLTLSAAKPTRTGHTFLGWSDSSTATGAKYSAGGSYTANGNATLYAVWKANTYTVSYNANGGTGAPASQTKTHGVTLTLSAAEPARTGYTFLGWALKSNAASAEYAAGASFGIEQDTVLYAVWKQAAADMAYDVQQDGYAFGNIRSAFEYASVGPGTSYPIKYDTFRIIFGDTVAGKSKYKQAIQSRWSGNCCGMAATSALFFNGESVTPESFGKSSVASLKLTDSNGSITAVTFIEAMQIAQYTEQFAQHYKGNRVTNSQLANGSSLNGLYDEVKASLQQGEGTIIGIGKTNVGAHALLAYGLEKISASEQRMYVYDCNFPGEIRYFTLNVSGSGAITGWTYDMGGYGVWGTVSSGECYISYIPYDTIEYIWNNRGRLYDNNELLSFSGENLSIYDFEGREVARIVDGQLRTNRDDIYEMPELSMTWTETRSIFLPKDYYTIVSNDGAELELSMVDGNLGATVRTTTSVVSFAVDNGSRENTVIVENASHDDTYEVRLESSFSGVKYENVVVCGTGKGESISISNDMDTLSIANCNISSLQINGVEQVSYLITSYAGAGGTISPLGDVSVKVDASQQYTITPYSGYCIDRVLVDGIDIGAVSEYTFSNVQKDHTIIAQFRKAYDISGVLFDSVAGCATASVSNDRSVRMVCALYAEDGRMLWTTTKAIPAGSSTVQFDIPDQEASRWSTMKVMMLDSGWVPLCDCYILDN